MRCKQCGSSFKLSIWIMQCGECKSQYCTKCMKRRNGICYCDKCTVLVTRPPDIPELMKLKSKDLQEYLNRHNIATYGLVEKRELVDLFCTKTIPVKSSKSNTVFNKIFSNFEQVLSLPERLNGQNASTTTPRPQRPHMFPSTSSGNLFMGQFFEQRATNTNSLPREYPPQPPPRRQSSPQTPAASAPQESPALPKKIPKLEDYASVDELTNLSAKELKIILSFNRVDYKGCVEKTELLDKVVSLWVDTHKNSTELSEDLEDLCKLCMDAPLDCVLLECGHIATCISCGKKLAECPICRQYVSRVVRTFKA